MAWFLPKEPTKFTFPGPVGLTHKPRVVLAQVSGRGKGGEGKGRRVKKGGEAGRITRGLRRVGTQEGQGNGEKKHLSWPGAGLLHLVDGVSLLVEIQ